MPICKKKIVYSSFTDMTFPKAVCDKCCDYMQIQLKTERNAFKEQNAARG